MLSLGPLMDLATVFMKQTQSNSESFYVARELNMDSRIYAGKLSKLFKTYFKWMICPRSGSSLQTKYVNI